VPHPHSQLRQLVVRYLPDPDGPTAEFALRLVIVTAGYAGLVVLYTWVAMLVIGGLHSALTPALPAVGYWQAVPVGVIVTLVVWLVRGLDRGQRRTDTRTVEAQTLRMVNRLWAEVLAATPDREAAAQQFSGQLSALIALHDFEAGRQ
jgi:hypothetical protein